MPDHKKRILMALTASSVFPVSRFQNKRRGEAWPPPSYPWVDLGADGNRIFQLNYNLHTDDYWKGNSGNGNGNKDNSGSGNSGEHQRRNRNRKQQRIGYHLFLSGADHLKNNFRGVKNDYIAKLLYELLDTDVSIEGSAENLFKCPCCQYKTLDMRGEYEICPVCQWEDDGNDDDSLYRYSSPNRMPLFEAILQIM